MMMLSQNGWQVHPDTSHYVRFSAGGRGWWAANDDCAVVAGEYIALYVAEVEPVAGGQLDDWSANTDLRPIRGQVTGFSNHDSATAWDLNSLKHPRGVRGTLTAAQTAAVHRILASITDDEGRRVLRWGGDYIHAPVDTMHAEIDATPDQVAQAADKIRARRRPTPPPQESALSSPEVIELKTAIAAAAAAVWTAPTIAYNDTTDRTKPVDPQRPMRSAAVMLEQTDRLIRKQDGQIAALSFQIATLTAAVSALAAASPAGVKAAFDQGVADLQHLLSQVDITVTTDGG